MRSKYKLPYFGNMLWTFFYKGSTKNEFKLYTTNRKITISSLFSWVKFYVHNGKTFYKLHITKDMNGTKLGEYSITKKKCVFKSKKKRNKKSNKKLKKKNRKKK